jgi:hypothetical protein
MLRFIQLFILVLFISNLYSFSFAQGKLFTKEEANELFGPVLRSVEISVPVVHNLINQTNSRLMFRVAGNQAIILDENRNVLHPAGVVIKPQDVFSVYSTAVLNELLSSGNGGSVNIEQRREVLSITFGVMTMEVGAFCPPFCSSN